MSDCPAGGGGNSSISQMPGPNALLKNWIYIVAAVSSLYLNNLAS